MKRFRQLSLMSLLLMNFSFLPAQGWKLVWSDEFNGPEIEMESWTFEHGCGIRNNEKEYYSDRPENARIENGNLMIETRRENMGGYSPWSSRAGRNICR